MSESKIDKDPHEVKCHIRAQCGGGGDQALLGFIRNFLVMPPRFTHHPSPPWTFRPPYSMILCWNVLGRVTKQNPTLPQPSVPAGSPYDRCLSHGTAKVVLSRTVPRCPVRDIPPTRVVSLGGSSTLIRAPSLTDLGIQDLVFIRCLVYLKQIQATWTLTKSPRSDEVR